MNDHFHYFGYGSLVNERTRKEVGVSHAVSLIGWQREWRLVSNREGKKTCTLTIRKNENNKIRGVLVREPVSSLPALDEREALYDRIELSKDSYESLTDKSALETEKFYVYQGMTSHVQWGCSNSPILLSYVDAVLDGFHQIWPKDGIDHFMETTDGWHVPILDDRAAPRYPRAVRISLNVQRNIDAALKNVGANIISNSL